MLALLTDSLRYWVTEMHVDGFRFDLASALARSMHDVDLLSAFFDVVHQDPVRQRVKLIAEPWDVGPGGYQVGDFPPLWTEWNGRYRDTVRDFWRGAHVGVRDLGYRLTGLVRPVPLRRPAPVRLHQLRHRARRLHPARPGLLQAQAQRGQRRGQPGRRDDNRSWNCGVEGATDDPAVLALRARQVRNLLATLLLSTGRADADRRRRAGPHPAAATTTPTARTTRSPGWTGRRSTRTCSPSSRRLIALRRALARAAAGGVLRGPRDPRHGLPGTGGTRDLAWFAPAGGQLTTEDWFDTGLQTLGMYLDGRGIRHRDAHGRPLVDDSYLVQLHAGTEPVTVHAARPAVGRRLRAGRLHRVRRPARPRSRRPRARRGRAPRPLRLGAAGPRGRP